MEKRLILALTLSLLVMIAWSSFVSKTYHIENKGVINNISGMPVVEEPRKIPVQAEPPVGPFTTFSQGDFSALFSESQAAITEAVFPNFGNHKFILERGFQINDNSLNFQQLSSSARDISFTHFDKDKKITKKFLFPNSKYSMELEIDIENISSQDLNFQFPLVVGIVDFAVAPDQARFHDILMASNEKNFYANGRKEIVPTAINFMGFRDRYFCVIVEPQGKDYKGYVKKLGQKSEVSLLSPIYKLSPGQKIVQKFLIYLGPQDLQIINTKKPSWSVVVNFGTFDFIAKILLGSLNFIFSIVNNWGWAIIILSVLIYLVLFPLTLSQMRSMKKMQALQPHIEELKTRYKNNPQKLNEEMLVLYRVHKVNPLGGCLPLILQLPIFFSLYQALMRSTVLKGATFLWVKDLSSPDRLPLPLALPLVGKEINILPVLMAIAMFFQQKSTLASASSGSAEQQKMMMIILPVMFGFMFYFMPAGLVLYWLVNSSLMLAYQLKINKTK